MQKEIISSFKDELLLNRVPSTNIELCDKMLKNLLEKQKCHSKKLNLSLETSNLCFKSHKPIGISCTIWDSEYYITVPDIIKIIKASLYLQGKPILSCKKLEEGIHSDLRSLKNCYRLESSKSELLRYLHRQGSIKTLKKQKVFIWKLMDFDKLLHHSSERLERCAGFYASDFDYTLKERQSNYNNNGSNNSNSNSNENENLKDNSIPLRSIVSPHLQYKAMSLSPTTKETKRRYSHGDRDFQCHFCKSTFRRMEHLKRHSRTHTGKRPFICGNAGCKKTFTRRDNLVQHSEIHLLCEDYCVSGFGAGFGSDGIKQEKHLHAQQNEQTFIEQQNEHQLTLPDDFLMDPNLSCSTSIGIDWKSSLYFGGIF